MSAILAATGILDAARFVVSYAWDDSANSIDMLDALHPQTIVAYSMNGRDLSVPHGAPLRLRVERQLGYKGLKFLERLVVTNEFDDGGTKGDLANGWAWYTGI
jgi:DMSO/TMAO reductase YedYZ molybdopterin-dependent catalytic subunit